MSYVALTELYSAALGRAPLADEQQIALEHVGKREDKRKAWEDVVWALIHTREFLFRH